MTRKQKRRDVGMIGFDLQERDKLKKANFNKSQQKILAEMKKKNEEDLNIKISTSLKKALLTTDDNGNTIADRLAARAVASLEQKEEVSVKDINEIREALGENSKNVDLKVDGKMDLKKELEKLASGEDF